MSAAEPAADVRSLGSGGARRLALSVLVLAWGAQAIVAQSVLLREALVLMFGSELAWGIVLFAWLLGVGVGAGVSGAVAGRLRRADLVLVLVLLALGATTAVDLWAFRGARAWLGVGPGELLPLPKMALAALLLVCPAGALVGAAFPLAASVGRDANDAGWKPWNGRHGDRLPAATHAAQAGPLHSPCLSFGGIYALESTGSLIGGAVFSFWAVEHLAPLQTLLICAGLTLAASAGLLLPPADGRFRGDRPLHAVPGEGVLRRWWLSAAALALACIAMLLAAVFGPDLHHRLVERRWRSLAPGYELVAETESRHQNLALGRLAQQYTLYCDGQVAADFPDPYTFTPLAHFWLCQHPEPEQVLLIGGGAEGLLSEILAHPVRQVDYVQTDPRQLDLIRPHLTDEDREALADPRVTVHYQDARYYVKTQRGRFDLVIARLPEPTSAHRARFYTDQFYAELRAAMSRRAVLCLTATAAPGELPPVTRAYLASIRATLARHFPHIVVSWGDPAHLLVATVPDLMTTDTAELARRYTQRQVWSERFDPLLFDATDWLEPTKLARRKAELDQVHAPQINTDLWPGIYLQRLELWEAATSGGVGPGRSVGGVIRWLRSVRLIEVLAALLAGGAATLLACRFRRGRRGWAAGTVAVSIASTGLVTMALSIIWLYAFQNLYGYVYQRIGWIIALFMAGLVLGCLMANRLLRRLNRHEPGARASWWWLAAVDVLLAALALASPLVLKTLAAAPAGPTAFTLVEGCISVMVILTGWLGGAAFPLASKLQLHLSGQVGAAAGRVVSADHLGACLGALLCGVLLVPVFGTVAAAILLAGTKVGSAVLLIVGRKVQSPFPAHAGTCGSG